MGLLKRLFGQKQKLPVPAPIYEALIPDSLSLGWYFNPERQQWQMVKIPSSDRATHL
jgi:hypothetical protein